MNVRDSTATGVQDPEARRRELYGLLGDLPPRDRPIRSVRISAEHRPAYELETLMLDLNGAEPVPAYFLRPAGAGSEPLPAVLYNHAHGYDYDLGKDELLRGRSVLQQPAYGEALTAAGYAVLCVDMWSFGDRRGRTETALFRESLWKGQVLWGMMVYDTLRAFDYLASRPDVDATRIATLGMSLGSTMAWWAAALEPRIRACVDICCLTDYEALIEARGLDGHGIYYFVPGLLRHFTSAQINALIAPRPHLGLAGNYDALTPPAGLDRIDAALREAYAAAGAPEAWELRRYEVGHIETAAMRASALAFLSKWL
jgi:dienelactone hydrolase